jgi:hypothetical protein
LKVASFIVQTLSVLPAASRGVASRAAAFALALLGALALHAVLLTGVASGLSDDDLPARAPVLSVRRLAGPPLPAPAASPDHAAAMVPPVAIPAPAPAPAKAARRAVAARTLDGRQRAASPQAAAAAQPDRRAAADIASSPPAPPVAVAMAALSIEPARSRAIDVPVYATRLPEPGVWRYRLTRGAAVGRAQLRWQPDPALRRYELQLEGWVDDVPVLDWVSRGAIDAAGIAPERFALRRRSKDREAANFQRDAGKVTFSGPTHELPLVAGVQDRLSWLVQLPAILQAEPMRLAAAGAKVDLLVVGARGGGDVWTFEVAGTETVGETPALKLVREPRREQDLRVEVWLDPVHDHRLLRARMIPTQYGTPLELELAGQ